MKHTIFDLERKKPGTFAAVACVKRVAVCAALLPAIGVTFSSCNKNDEPPSEINLPIIRQYLPVTVQFAADDNEWKEKIKGWANKKVIVNVAAELPDDPLGFSAAYKGVDFSDYTLLITYDVRDWEMETYDNRYYRDNVEKSYNWTIGIGTSTPPSDNPEQMYFTRYAILVKKLPQDATLNIWFSHRALNWDWNE